MTTATVLAITLSIIGILVAFNAAWLLFSSLFPKFIRQSQAACARPFKSLLVGTGLGFIPFIISVQLLGDWVTGILGWPIFLIVLVLALAGTAAVAQRIGSGMPSQNDRLEPWHRNLRGGVVLSFSYLLPFIGWLWLPISLTFGSGVAFLTALQVWKERKEAKLEQAEAEAAEAAMDQEQGTDAKSSRLGEEVVS